MRRIKLTLEYQGTNYCGWQQQDNGISIQAVIQDVLKVLFKKKTTLYGSGRTDADVHAEIQVAHFNAETRMTCFQLMKGLNSLLPRDIVVRAVEDVTTDFHAQFSAIGKLYRYTILNRQFPTALNQPFCWYIHHDLDVEAMRKAARLLEGEKDFTSFRGANCSARHAVRRIDRIVINREGDYIQSYFIGSGFLKHMVRILMGTLVDVGRGLRTPESIEEILQAKNRRKAGPTAPAMGLCLVQPFYDQEEMCKRIEEFQD
ncbi:MAG: tRNA pseudouridine(38-40) synthase TruA [Candidatus Nitrohelix vancouverensis]|uniref:tRNA pseudouridine synthase A n=1 Tax=Candidatus Nitrohelix vancouverensis TaxID=2705534 RepID=A0A7T0C3H0_9BACT|nr:MAG: tRNA pseudouridine(38-40) synthase TruA [Candidatus Nitrohelix vancouverensis]